MKNLTTDERLHRIQVLMMDIEIANEEGSKDIYNKSVAELYHYTTSEKPPIHSYRWESYSD